MVSIIISQNRQGGIFISALKFDSHLISTSRQGLAVKNGIEKLVQNFNSFVAEAAEAEAAETKTEDDNGSPSGAEDSRIQRSSVGSLYVQVIERPNADKNPPSPSLSVTPGVKSATEPAAADEAAEQAAAEQAAADKAAADKAAEQAAADKAAPTELKIVKSPKKTNG